MTHRFSTNASRHNLVFALVAFGLSTWRPPTASSAPPTPLDAAFQFELPELANDTEPQLAPEIDELQSWLFAGEGDDSNAQAAVDPASEGSHTQTAGGARKAQEQANLSLVSATSPRPTRPWDHSRTYRPTNLHRILPQSPRLRLGGWIAQGVTGNFNRPTNGLNRPVVFNDLANDYALNQLALTARADLIGDDSAWNVTAGIDAVYGYDSQFLTVPGLERHHDGTRKLNSDDSNYGISLPQLFLEFRSTVMNRPFALKLGHFESVTAYESPLSPSNALYSHSYLFSYANPFTHTGALASFDSSPQLTWFLGYTQGWDNWQSHSDRWGILSGLALRDATNANEIRLLTHIGDDVTNTLVASAPRVATRQSYHVFYRRRLSETWGYVFDAAIGRQEDAVVFVDTGASTVTFRPASWYGVTQYVQWAASAQSLMSLRFDWFRDANHSRIGTPVEFDPGGSVLKGGNYFAITAGCRFQLHDNVFLRPEIRWDWSDTRGSDTVPGGDSSIRAFGDRTDADQLTIATDLVIEF